MECRGQPASVTCERSSASAQARPDPHGSTTGTSISHISTAGALLNAQFSHGHCRDAPRAPSTSRFSNSLAAFSSLCSLPGFVPQQSSWSQGMCCVPVFGLLSGDPEAADGPQGPVTPCQDQSQLNGQSVSSLVLYWSANGWVGICWHSSLDFPVHFPLSLSSNPFQLISTGLVCWDHWALFVCTL